MKGLSLRSLVTGLNGNGACKKALRAVCPVGRLLLIALLCFWGNKGFAGVVVTPGSGGSNICSTAAIGGTSPAYTVLGTMTVTETSAGDLTGPGTDVLVLSAPAGWQFNTATPPGVTYLTEANITSISVFSMTATSITISIVTSGTNVIDQFKIIGLQVQAMSTSAAAGNIYPSSSTGIAGLTPGAGGTNFGSLSLSVPQTPSVAIAASPPGAICPGTNVVFLPTLTSGGTMPTYQWKVNGVNINTGATYAGSSFVSGNTVSCVMISNSSCLTFDTAVSNTYTVTVLPGPLPVNGATITCPGTIITLNDATTGGTWSSGNTAVATTDGSGDVTGVAVGTAIISYISGSCPAIANITVNDPPLAPVLTTTVATMCSGNITTMTAIGTPFPTTILSQNFNSGITPWTVDSTGGSFTVPGSAWKDCGNGYINEQGIYYSPDSSAFAMSNSDTSGSSSYTSSKLISPVFSLAGYSGATFTFQQAYEYWPAGDTTVSVQISADSGSTWSTLQNYVGTNVGSRTDFIPETFSLNAYLGQTKLRLRFYYYCHWGYYWAIDNVLVTGISSIAIPVWSPSTYLYTNAACTTAYTSGTALSTVYVHPTNITFAGAVTYTATAVSAGCSSANSSAVNFTPSPSPILGTGATCVGTTTSLSDTTAGGTWSSGNTGIATVSAGVVTGVTTGTVTMSYVLVGTGCAATKVVTVNSLPAAIGGNKGVCLGATTNLSDTTASGAWTSGNTAIASIGSVTGIVTGVATGNANITYAIGTGCNTVSTITVNPLPKLINGDITVCVGLTTTLSDSVGGGAWSSGATTIATAGSGSGVITGIAAGSTLITYTLGTGCKATTQVSVNPLMQIAGTLNVCAGLSITLSDGIAGGTWSSSNTSVAAIGSGIVQGIMAGTTIVSYVLPTGCMAMAVFTVNPNPPAITGNPEVCIESTTDLTDASTGGTWSSGVVSHATVGNTTGIVTGVGTGSTVIRYTLPTGCFITQSVTVNPLPGIISGTMSACATLFATLSNSTGGGTWSSGTSSVATVGSTGIVSGVAAGTSVITYTLLTGCTATTIFTVNQLPLAISGNSQVCAGLTSSLSDGTHGGTWSSSATSVATIGTGGIATGVGLGAATITYTLATGCIMTAAITVDPLPGSVNGTPIVCAGMSTTLSDTSNGGIWSSGATGFATVVPGTGTVTGVASGTAVITYTMPTGCMATNIVTVNPLPNAINGTVAVCVGLTTSLSNSSSGGAWSSSNIAIGSINTSGVVTGISAGITSISYTLGTGCFTIATVTVGALPLEISGSNSVCQADSISLNDATAGGMWSSSNPAVAGVGSATGNVTGLITGTAAISYTIPIAADVGCSVSKMIMVNLSPTNINGIAAVCAGALTSLSDVITGGIWSSSNTGVATIGSGSGYVISVIAGTTNVTYTLGDGCTAATVVTVNVMPTAVNGIMNVCSGLTTNLSDNVSGGIWTSNDTGIATIDATTGVVSGSGVGTATITYEFATGCLVTTVITVNETPGSIAGNAEVCLGFTMNLSDTATGGVWTSSNPSFASVGSGSGLVTTSSAGTVNIYYTLPNGCTTSRTVSVNPQPSVIGGTTDICAGTEIVLTDSISGGAWSSGNTAIATIGTGSGLLTGIGSGTTTISYALDAGCVATITVTVHLLPSSISGNNTVCAGYITTLSDPLDSSGTWSSSNISIATVGATTGVITGVNAGIATVTYSFAPGCTLATIITVNPLPSGIIEANDLCFNANITLSDTTNGGAWSSSNTGIAAIGSLSGNVSGITNGVTTITYKLNTGCQTTMALTVYPLPASISGIATVCAGLTVNLSDATGGGTWSSGATGIAIMGSVAGVVTGVVAGTATISYMLGTGCFVTDIVTVNPLPKPIIGNTEVCTGLYTNLTDSTIGGSWSSGSPGIATIGSATGIVNGITAGTGNMTYTLTTGCINTIMVTVNPLPLAIGDIANVCQGLTITLTDLSGGGMWSSGSSGIGSIDAVSGIVTGISAGVTAITYTLSTGCLVAKSITVNPAPAAIFGTDDVCVGNTITLSDTILGGVWSSGNVSIGTVGTSSGIVSGIFNGTTLITYTTVYGCITTYPVTVNPLPASISGTKTVCAGGTTNLSDALIGGLWSSGSPGIAGIGSGTGLVNGYLQGTATITYMSGYGCIATAVATVNPLPAAISGANNVCVGSMINVTDASIGGTWSSSNIGVATVGSGSGIVYGVSAGSVNITYTLGTGCIILRIITVNPLPSMIAGNKDVCQGLATALNDTLTGGTWISGNTGIATIGTASGIVSGNSTGTSVITYTLPTGCSITTNVTVNPLPSAIIGNTTFCVGLTTNLSDLTTSGTWSSGSTGVATVGSVTGVVAGSSAGIATITYSLATGCIATANVTVNTLAPIWGATFICSGTTTILSDVNGSGVWSSSNTSVAMIGSSTGSISGNISGTTTITFVLSAGCITSTVVTVNSLPSSITGTANVCAGLGVTLSDNTTGGNWISNNVSIATINLSTGYLTGITAGTTLITYMIGGTGCIATTAITVNPLPAAIYGVASVCKGLTTGLSDSTTVGTWSSSNTGIASVGSGTGMVTGIMAGTASITYTLATGCIQTMTITVNPLPSLISGTKSICAEFTTNLTDSITGGMWSSAESPGVVTVATTLGAVTGVLAGTATITYTLPTGCINTTIVTVNPLPSVITGSMAVCAGLTISLSDSSAGGVWASGITSVATVGSVTGIVSGIASGVAVITYILPTGCIATAGVTVNALPNGIMGVNNVCTGLTTALSDVNSGGVWSIAGSLGVASINAANGIVTGISAGTVMVTYTLGTGCITKEAVTVNPLPMPITGITNVCVGLTTGLTDATVVGNWSSAGLSGILSVGSATGIVTGIGAGTAMITYTLGTGCIATVNMTVNPLPANPQPMAGTANVCAGSSMTLTDVTAGGTWSSGSTGIAVIGSVSGIVSGLVEGTANITYTLNTGCIATAIITINPLPNIINGAMNVCAGLTVNLSDGTAGGAWSSSITAIGSVSASGVVTGVLAGTTVISYVLATGCLRTEVITVNPLPMAVMGATDVCTGTTITLSDASESGTWSSGGIGIAEAGSGTGIITGVSAGSVVITYTLPTSCNITYGITVLPSSAVITGITNVCSGLSTALSDITVGGVWSSGSTGVATVGSATGMVTGILAGTTAISYTMGNECYAAIVYTVNPLPAAISGDRSVCLGSSSGLSDGLTGGTWSIVGTSGIATIGITSGIVSGLVLGTAVVTYTLPTGCTATAEITVNPYPAIITGAATVCQGATIYMSDGITGGVWSSGNTAIAAVNMATGAVTGAGGGSVTISYTLTTGCSVTKPVTVNPIFPIAGQINICAGSSEVFSDLTGGGAWSSSNTTVATISTATGVANAVASGTTIISYGLSTGCSYSMIITVNVLPASFNVIGGGSYCAGGTGLSVGLNGSDTGISYELYKDIVLVTTATGTGAAIYYGPYTGAGSYDIVARNVSTGCTDTMAGMATISISPVMSPSVNISAGIGDTLCAGVSAAFTALAVNGGTAPVYEWFVNGTHVAATGSSYSFIPLSGDVVSVKLTSNAVCVSPDTASSAYLVMTTPDLLPSVSISASPSDSLCAHETATIIPAPVNGGSSPVYRWVKNGITAAFGSTYTYTPANGDNVFCVLHSNYRCLVTDSANSGNNINFTVVPLPTITISAHPGISIAPGQSDTLIAAVTNGGATTTYQWGINSIAIPGATSDIYINNDFLNNDTVACIASGDNYCSGIPVKAEIIINVSNTVVNQVVTGEGDIKLLPNPNKGQFMLSGTTGNTNDAKIKLEVTDMLGQIVFEKDILAISGKINESISLSPTLPNGIYLLHFLDDISSDSGTVNLVFHFVINR